MKTYLRINEQNPKKNYIEVVNERGMVLAVSEKTYKNLKSLYNALPEFAKGLATAAKSLPKNIEDTPIKRIIKKKKK